MRVMAILGKNPQAPKRLGKHVTDLNELYEKVLDKMRIDIGDNGEVQDLHVKYIQSEKGLDNNRVISGTQSVGHTSLINGSSAVKLANHRPNLRNGIYRVRSSRDILAKMFELFGVEVDEESLANPERPFRFSHLTPRKVNTPSSPSSHLSILLFGTPMEELEMMEIQSKKKKFNLRQKKKFIPPKVEDEKEIATKQLVEKLDCSSMKNRRMKYLKFKNILIESMFYSRDIGDLDVLLGYNMEERSQNIQLTFSECYTKLCYVSSLRYPDMKLEDALERSCSKYLWPYISRTVATATKLLKCFAVWITDDADIAALFHYYQAPLHRILLYYGKKIPTDKKLAYNGLFMWNNSMTLDGFLAFARDFDIVPNFAIEADLKKVFESIKTYRQQKKEEGTRSFFDDVDTDSYNDNLNMNEFSEAIARIAYGIKSIDSIQNKCRDILTFLGNKYISIFGEPMLTEKNRVLFNRLGRNTVDRTKLLSSFEFEVITGEKSLLMTKDEALYLRYSRNKRDYNESVVRQNSLNNSNLLMRVSLTGHKGNNQNIPSIDRAEETEQHLENVMGKEILNVFRDDDSLYRIFVNYCNVTDRLERLLSLNQWEIFCQDFGFKEKLSVLLNSSEDAEDYLRSLFVKRSTRVRENTTFLTFYNFLHTIYDLWVKTDIRTRETKEMCCEMNELAGLRLFLSQHLSEVRIVKNPNPIPRRRQPQKLNLCERPTGRGYELIDKKGIRQFDIYKGPKIIAKCEDRIGFIVYEGSSARIREWERSSYMTLVLLNTVDEEINFEEETKQQILTHASISNTFSQFVERILDFGLDLVGSLSPLQLYGGGSDLNRGNKKTNASRDILVGRSYRIQNVDLLVIGCILDSPGYFCCLNWQPSDGNLESDNFSMTLYINSELPEFDICYNCFMKSSNIQELRDVLQRENLQAVPMLYF